MHKYLRAIGFSEITTKKQIEDFLEKNLNETRIISTYKTIDQRVVGQYQILVAQTIGIDVMGEQDKDGKVRIECYFPFLKGYDYTLIQECTIERHSDKETFAGIIDDDRLGISIIFYLININEYKKVIHSKDIQAIKIDRIFLSALSIEGKIILPIEKKSIPTTNFQSRIIKNNNLNEEKNIDVIKNDMLNDEYDGFSMYDSVNERYKKEDLYSIVDTSIVPYGIECDKYMIVAEILSVSYKENTFSKEQLVEMRLNALGLVFNLVINEKDLQGEPKPGRRFKGVVWLVGDVEFLKVHKVEKEQIEEKK